MNTKLKDLSKLSGLIGLILIFCCAPYSVITNAELLGFILAIAGMVVLIVALVTGRVKILG